MTNPTPSPADRERGHAEIAAGVAILTATQQTYEGTLSDADYLAAVGDLLNELWPDEPRDVIAPLSWVALRAVTLYAEATRRGVHEVLAELGAEAAWRPPTEP